MDVHKRSVYITGMKEDGSISEQYEIGNDRDAWITFRERYLSEKPKIALEVSSSGKYVTRLLIDMGFPVHMANPIELALIFKSAKKNDRGIHTNLQSF